MGTRHLIAVKQTGQYRIAQYGQWDGYPDSTGCAVLNFLKTWNRPMFEEHLRACRFYTRDELAKLDQVHADNPEWLSAYPTLDRNTGFKILEMVQGLPQALHNNLEFAADSLFCEWAYVIDLDLNTFEVYKGFNHTPLTEDDRFYDLMPAADAENKRAKWRQEPYYPVVLVKSYPLGDLPEENVFLDDCKEPPEEEEFAELTDQEDADA